MKTNFSYDVQYPAQSDTTQAQRDAVMDALGPTLQALFAVQDKTATVVVSDSHRGNGNKLVELTTTLGDTQVAEILQAFSAQHGVLVAPLE